MKTLLRVLAILLPMLPAVAWTGEKDDRRNVYEVFGDLYKPPAGITLEEDVTSRIKRYMANLLYPVDLSSFTRPEKDENFRALVTALQKQMGETATGTLTYRQFNRLHEAAQNIDGIGVNLSPGKLVYRSDDGNTVGARGTGAMNDLANPINVNRMLCVKSEGKCEMTAAELNLHNIPMLDLAPPMYFDIKNWTPSRIISIREHPCGTATLTVDVDAKDVTITSVPHAGLPFCSKEPANIWKLVDGFPVAWNIELKKYHEARALVYEPAKKLFPERKPAK